MLEVVCWLFRGERRGFNRLLVNVGKSFSGSCEAGGRGFLENLGEISRKRLFSLGVVLFI